MTRIDNKNIKEKASPAKKHPVATSWEQTDTQKGLNKIEGIKQNQDIKKFYKVKECCRLI